MSRWNIAKILLYSHDGRRRDVDLDLGKVNIITGRSGRGKSALTEVIDYATGAHECHIPGRVRGCSAWVGVLWQNGRTQCLICRRIPAPQNRSSNEVQLTVGGGIDVPVSAARIVPNTNSDAAARRFGQLLGMGDVEMDGTPAKSGVRVSARHTMPFVLLDDDVIISKINLLRGSNDDRRQHIIDTMPYFLGITDEATVALAGRLRRLRNQLAAEDRSAMALRRVVGEETGRALALAIEAAELGMLPRPDPDADRIQLLETLRAAANYSPGDQVLEQSSQLQSLYEDERRLSTQAGRIRSQIDSARALLDVTRRFAGDTAFQEERLRTIEIFPREEIASACPLCEQPLSAVTDSVETVYSALSRVSHDLTEVGRERPRLDGYIQEREDESQGLRSALTSVRRQIAGLVREQEVAARAATLEQRRFHTSGRVSLFLEAAQQDHVGIDVEGIERLRDEVEALSLQLDTDARNDALTEVRLRISQTATEIIARLPFDEQYRGYAVDFNPRDLSVGVLTPARRATMRGVGADENYLSLHFAFLLAFQRFFSQAVRPVPGVLLLDQPSRPFFPPDTVPGEVVLSAAEERQDLKSYFNVLFDEVGRGDGLQIIVLEHAYFADDPRFVSATKQRWATDGLIPADWPSVEWEQPVLDLEL